MKQYTELSVVHLLIGICEFYFKLRLSPYNASFLSSGLKELETGILYKQINKRKMKTNNARTNLHFYLANADQNAFKVFPLEMTFSQRLQNSTQIILTLSFTEHTHLVIKFWGCAVECDVNISTQAIPTGGHSVLYKIQHLLGLIHWRRVTTINSHASTRRLKTQQSYLDTGIFRTLSVYINRPVRIFRHMERWNFSTNKMVRTSWMRALSIYVEKPVIIFHHIGQFFHKQTAYLISSQGKAQMAQRHFENSEKSPMKMDRSIGFPIKNKCKWKAQGPGSNSFPVSQNSNTRGGGEAGLNTVT